jgi:hypothetical protein
VSRVIEGTTSAWLTEYSRIGPKELRENDGDNLVNRMSFSAHDMTSGGWVRVGRARIEVTLDSSDEIVTGQVAALRAQQTQVRAEAEAKATEIERRIQTLLAISYDGDAA